ncbi:exopolygalacturonase PelB [Halioxenophilus aromaticivorans]|uniref:Exopolygalacturonase PelB n=1 Tax=Halioxenophilus aromaticivorans TaxID=1306992 RepID=A0AAV3U544_9ALTE
MGGCQPSNLESGLAKPQAASSQATTVTEQSIVAAIALPAIAQQDFPITDFANHQTLTKDARPAILAAIDSASENGGGRVVIPAGNWTSAGPIHLKSNINLHLAEGAHLTFSPRAEDYLPAVFSRWEGTEMYGYSPLIYANDVHDIAITGPGIIDGNADSEFFAWYPNEKPDQLKLRKMGIAGDPVSQRQFGEGHFLRPGLIQIINAERVLLDGFEARNSPFWINHLIYTTHATVRNLNVNSHHPNNDGVDVDSSSYVLIENNVFRTGDDSVVVKSGRDQDGRSIGKPSEYVVIRNNDMGGEDGIAVGSEMSGGIRHVYFTDNILRTGVSAVRFKANLDRGGVVEHIYVKGLQVESFRDLFWFQLNYPGELDGQHPSTYRDIVFEDIHVQNTDTFLEIHAPAPTPASNITFKNIVVEHTKNTFILNNVANLNLDNVTINNQTINAQLNWQAKTDSN